jgi:hypothetical protein
VASLDAGSSRQELLYLFSQYGELRDVADDPLGRPNCCLVEFYDTRHAGELMGGGRMGGGGDGEVGVRLPGAVHVAACAGTPPGSRVPHLLTGESSAAARPHAQAWC